MRSVMHAFNNHVKVLHDVTPIDLLAQSAVLSDEVVMAYLYKHSVGPFLFIGGERSAPTILWNTFSIAPYAQLQYNCSYYSSTSCVKK